MKAVPQQRFVRTRPGSEIHAISSCSAAWLAGSESLASLTHDVVRAEPAARGHAAMLRGVLPDVRSHDGVQRP